MTVVSSLAGLELDDERRDRLLAVAADIVAFADNRGMDRHSISLRTLLDQARRTTPIRVVVTGDFKSGKSTLVNALLGVPVSPAAPHPSNPVVLVFDHADEQRITVVDEPGEETTVDQAELERVLTTPSRQRSPYVMARIGLPSPVLGRGVQIVDVPFTQVDLATQRLLYQFLSRADVVIYVKNALSPAAGELGLLSQITSDEVKGNLFVVLNRSDEVSPENLDDTVERLVVLFSGPAGDEVPLFRTNARLALSGRMRGSAEDVAASGVPELEDAIAEQLMRSPVAARLTDLTEKLGQYLSHVELLLAARMRDHDKSLARLELRRDYLLGTRRAVDSLRDQRDVLVDRVRTEAEAVVRAIVTQFPAWALEHRRHNPTLNPLRTRSQVEAAAGELLTHLGKQAAAAFDDWVRETLLPIVRQALVEMVGTASEIVHDHRIDLDDIVASADRLGADLVGQASVPLLKSGSALLAGALAGAVAIGPAALIAAPVIAGIIGNFPLWARQSGKLSASVATMAQEAAMAKARPLAVELSDSVMAQVTPFIASVEKAHLDAVDVLEHHLAERTGTAEVGLDQVRSLRQALSAATAERREDERL